MRRSLDWVFGVPVGFWVGAGDGIWVVVLMILEGFIGPHAANAMVTAVSPLIFRNFLRLIALFIFIPAEGNQDKNFL